MPATLSEQRPLLFTRAATIAADLRGLVCDHLELAVLEAHRAGNDLARLVGGAVVVATLCATAWLSLVAGGIVWAASAGISWAMALAIAACINLAAAGILALRIRALTRTVPFAATLRQLRRDAELPGDQR